MKDDPEAGKRVVTIDLFQHILIPTSGRGPLRETEEDFQKEVEEWSSTCVQGDVRVLGACF